uniref:OTU domain-containing protein 1 isoform X1 n=3 Tax=Myxine glutinosa TaxID=7769 RepID=UPI00358F9018
MFPTAGGSVLTEKYTDVQSLLCTDMVSPLARPASRAESAGEGCAFPVFQHGHCFPPTRASTSLRAMQKERVPMPATGTQAELVLRGIDANLVHRTQERTATKLVAFVDPAHHCLSGKAKAGSQQTEGADCPCGNNSLYKVRQNTEDGYPCGVNQQQESVPCWTPVCASGSSERLTVAALSAALARAKEKSAEARKQRKYLTEMVRQDEYLQHKNLYRFHIIPDGNCLYRAVSKAAYGHQGNHVLLREQTVHYIADHLEDFVTLIEGDIGEFIINAAQNGSWAGYPELLAMSSLLDVNIDLTTGGSESCAVVSSMLHFMGSWSNGAPTIYLSWMSNGHYDTLLPTLMPNPEYEEWSTQCQVQQQCDEALARSMAESLSRLHLEKGCGER